ncbi:Hypothetical protein NTJ_16054 [Nesidiocoris tenuis]|uniref:Uncharacterized protein n=1 Tax=Nesidiocoris tenuis TaxID=355587 RepID=A0ABN7BFU1_9HEMI|nr:Hypothetical protein NTJ_16054 [Nesidiocoris tenuis]
MGSERRHLCRGAAWAVEPWEASGVDGFWGGVAGFRGGVAGFRGGVAKPLVAALPSDFSHSDEAILGRGE